MLTKIEKSLANITNIFKLIIRSMHGRKIEGDELILYKKREQLEQIDRWVVREDKIKQQLQDGENELQKIKRSNILSEIFELEKKIKEHNNLHDSSLEYNISEILKPYRIWSNSWKDMNDLTLLICNALRIIDNRLTKIEALSIMGADEKVKIE